MTQMNYELLMVDDDELFLVLNKRELVKSGFHLEPKSFLDAESALTFLKSLDQPEKKVLVFLDINMPQIDGWQFLKILRELNLNLTIKHILVTSSTDPKDRIIAKDYPEIIGFLEKPIDKHMLKELSEQEAFQRFLNS
jgi:CheY-like chemotaxis protein